MEIQKIFSDYYDEERFYSVLMNEDELYLYQSLFSDEDEDEEEVSSKGLSGLAKAGIGTAAVGGGVIGSKYAGKALNNRATKIRNKLIEEGKFGGEEFAKNRKRVNTARALQKPADFISENSVKAGKFTKKHVKNAVKWVKSHPKTAAGIILGTAAAGYGAKKLHDRNNDEV